MEIKLLFRSQVKSKVHTADPRVASLLRMTDLTD